MIIKEQYYFLCKVIPKYYVQLNIKFFKLILIQVSFDWLRGSLPNFIFKTKQNIIAKPAQTTNLQLYLKLSVTFWFYDDFRETKAD